MKILPMGKYKYVYINLSLNFKHNLSMLYTCLLFMMHQLIYIYICSYLIMILSFLPYHYGEMTGKGIDYTVVSDLRNVHYLCSHSVFF